MTTLEQMLIHEGKTKWLDAGSGGSQDARFDHTDIVTPDQVPLAIRDRYRQLDLVRPTDEQLLSFGAYDLIRLQHVFEHLTFEEGALALKVLGGMLNAGGYLLMSVPDLRKFALALLADVPEPTSRWWAETRIPNDAPPSAFFSVFAHGVPGLEHKWCYDYAGLEYQITRSGAFEHAEELRLDHPFASVPFTHNRPDVDVVILARKKSAA